ncbi:hypothetical protein ACWEKT_29390 [Nocardia takedensis]
MRVVEGTLPFVFDRKFHMGPYVGTHAQFLLRSGRSGYHDGRMLKYDSVVDVLFKNVAAVAVSENYFPLEVAYANAQEVDEFRRFMHCELGDRTLYALRGQREVGYVLASGLYWIDDPDGSTSEPSVLVETPQRSENMVAMTA